MSYGQLRSRTSLRTLSCPQEEKPNHSVCGLVEAAGVEPETGTYFPRKHSKTSALPTLARFRKLLVFEVGHAGALFHGQTLYVRTRVHDAAISCRQRWRRCRKAANLQDAIFVDIRNLPGGEP